MKPRIMFVDDEKRVLEALEDLLEPLCSKWDMDFVGDGERALLLLERAKYDVIVSDMCMPKLDGVRLLNLVRKNHPGVARIVLSGSTEQNSSISAAREAHQFLSKPCRAEELERVIERVCALESLISKPELRAAIARLQRLPSPPHTYLALTRLLADEKADARAAAEIVGRDPAMSAKVLQLVSSSFCGLGREINSIKHAITHLGVNNLRNLVLSVEVFAGCAHPSLASLHGHSMAVASRAAALASHEPKLSEDAFLAGLLHDVGKLVLVSAGATSIEEDHPAAGAYLVGLWGLPMSIVEVIASHHEPEGEEASLANIARLAHQQVKEP